MPKFKVWNDNDLEHVEIFKGDKVRIPPRGYILMERDDAVAFKGAFLAPIISDGVANPKTFKKIRVELHSADEAPAVKVADEPTCQACKYKASSDKDLAEHVQAMHRESIIVDEQAEKEIEAKKRGRPAKVAG